MPDTSLPVRLEYEPALDGLRALAIAAVVLFHEALNPMRIAGVAVIVVGVALLASDTTRREDEP